MEDIPKEVNETKSDNRRQKKMSAKAETLAALRQFKDLNYSAGNYWIGKVLIKTIHAIKHARTDW